MKENDVIPPDKVQYFKDRGYDVSEILYHGTDTEFQEFSRLMLRTADDFYTTPDVRSASFYGKIIYMCIGKQHPQADLLNDSFESKKLLHKIAEELYSDYTDHVEHNDEELKEIKKQIIEDLLNQNSDNENYDNWDADNDSEKDQRYIARLKSATIEYLIEVITSADERLYGYVAGGNIQAKVMKECFGMGYRSVRIYDANPKGHPVSVVFKNEHDIFILGKVSKDPMDHYINNLK
jgi:hypothetical protein